MSKICRLSSQPSKTVYHCEQLYSPLAPETDLLHYRLKRGYINQKNGMSLTGQGLVHSGRTNEMIDGSEVKNIWGTFSPASLLSFPSDSHSLLDKVMVDFPWYERMHALMGTSPVATRAAVAHSTSSIDTSVLARPTVSSSCYFSAFEDLSAYSGKCPWSFGLMGSAPRVKQTIICIANS